MMDLAMKSNGSLKDKVTLITGASKGIGRALAVGFATAGASVSCAARSKELLDSVVAEIGRNGGNAIAVAADVTQESQVDQMLQKTVERFKKRSLKDTMNG